jgi:hypothetical protein
MTHSAMSSCERAAPFVSELSRVETWSILAVVLGRYHLGRSVGLGRPCGNEAVRLRLMNDIATAAHS